MSSKSTEQRQRQANRRLGLTLGLIAVVFFLGLMLRMILLGR